MARTDDKDPLPPLQRRLPMQTLIHSRHHHAREHAANLTDRSEDSCTLCDLEGFTTRCENLYISLYGSNSLPRPQNVYRSTI